MKTEDLFLRVALKVQARMREDLDAENRKLSPNWQDLYAAQQRHRTASLLVDIIQDVIKENMGTVE